AAKGGLLVFSESLAREVGPLGIRVNCVVPGRIATPLLDKYHQRVAAERGIDYDRVVDEATRQIALRRLITPDEVAAVVAYLASEDARGITAQAIEVTGGLA